MTVAVIAFVALIILRVPIGFTMLGASAAYFALNPMMASILAQRMGRAWNRFPCWPFPCLSWLAARWREEE